MGQSNNLMKKILDKEKIYLLVLGVIVIIAIFPLLHKGFYSFHDEPNIAHFHQMIRSLSEGNIPPRWIPDVTYNYGGPYFNYFYHWPFYVGTLYYLLGFGLVGSFKLVMITTVVLSAVFFYLFIRKFFNAPAALGATALYTFTPYRAVDLYVRGSFGELWGFVFMPLILLALVLLIEKTTFKRLLFSSLSIALLIISHNSSAMMFLPAAFVFGVIYSYVNDRKKYLKHVGFVVVSFVGAMGLSCYYWLPAVAESIYIKPGSPFAIVDHFPFIKQLIIPNWGYGASLWGPDDGLSFQIGILNLFAVLASMLILFVYKAKMDKNKKRLLVFSLIAFISATLLMNIRSYFLWEIIPLADYIQFPWRLLLLTTFFTSILSAFLFEWIAARRKSFFWASIVVVLLMTIAYFRPEQYTNPDVNYYLRKYFSNILVDGRTAKLSTEYENNTEDYLPTTIWSDERPANVPLERIEVGQGTLDYHEYSSTKYDATVDSKEPTELVLHSFYYPGWTAYIDGQKTIVNPNKPVGDISLDIPSGRHYIKLVFEETPMRKIANLITIITLLIFIGSMFFVRKTSDKSLVK